MVDMMAWAELRESLREALDALENSKELIPWEDAHLCPERYRFGCAAHRGKYEKRSLSLGMF